MGRFDDASATTATTVDAAGAVMETDYTAKGDLLVATAAGTTTALAVGADGLILTADAAEASGVKWAAAAASVDDVFDVTANVVSNTGAASTVATDDFVFGSPQLDDDGDANHDYRMLFDKSSGAFAAGAANSTQWNSRGEASARFGYACSAAGAYTLSSGYYSVGSGQYSLAAGHTVTASSDYSFAFGRNCTASDIGTLAVGYYCTASGQGSAALGGYNNTASKARSATVAGKYGDTENSGEIATGWAGNAALGKKQHGMVVLGKQTTDATQTDLSTDNSTDYLAAPDAGSFYTYRIDVAAKNTTTAAEYGAWFITCGVLNNAGTVTVVGAAGTGAPSINSGGGDAAWDVSLGITSSTLRIKVTGAAGQTVEWTATAHRTKAS